MSTEPQNHEPQEAGSISGAILQRLMDAAPETIATEDFVPTKGRSIYVGTGLPKRYREEWPRPLDEEWIENLAKVNRVMRAGGLLALIGKRGTGKTRLAAESMRDICPQHGRYMTAMELFLRIRSTYGKKAAESESEVIDEVSKAPFLILDEVQERGNTAWEDRLLTHVIDRRYSSMRSTILVANLGEAALTESLGASISSRLNETGGTIILDGRSYRNDPEASSSRQETLPGLEGRNGGRQ